MSNTQLTVRDLTIQDEKAFQKALQQTDATDPNFAHYYTKGMRFEQYLYVLNSVKLGFELPKDHVPANIVYGFVGDSIVGRLTLRYNLNEEMVNTAGHVGIVVVPEFRKRGYGTAMMKQGLEIAKRADMPRILLTCDDGNESQTKLIEKCGGKLENVYTDPTLKVAKRRYWFLF